MQESGTASVGEDPDDATDRHEGWLQSSEGRFYVTLAAVALVALVGRVVYVALTRDLRIPSDGSHYHARAQALADGKGLANPILQELFQLKTAPPDATNPPGWSVVLAVATKLGLESLLAQKIFASVIGAATVVMTGLAGRAAFGRRAGLIAAAIVAVYPNVWLYERELMSEPLALLGVATCIWLAYRFLAQPSVVLAFAIGATVGLLALTRSEEIALLALLVLPLIWSARALSWQRRVAWLALAGVTCALVITPWVAYNSTRFDRPVVLSTGLGITMKAGNCDETYSGEFLGYYRDFCGPLPDGISSDQSVADGQLREVATEYMRAHLSRLPVVMAARIGRAFNLYRPFQQTRLEGERGGTPLWVERVGLLGFWLLIPCAVGGAIAARRRKVRIYPLLAFPVIVAISVVTTMGIVRYRVPAEIPLAILAAFGIDVALRHLALRRRAS